MPNALTSIAARLALEKSLAGTWFWIAARRLRTNFALTFITVVKRNGNGVTRSHREQRNRRPRYCRGGYERLPRSWAIRRQQGVHAAYSGGKEEPTYGMFEIIDHTADIGLRIQAASLEELFQDAAVGMFSLLLEDLTTVRQVTEESFEIVTGQGLALPQHAGGDEVCSPPVRLSEAWEDLLHDWLAELLTGFDARRMVFGRFEVRFTAAGLHGRAWGEKLDFSRHRAKMEIKAVTYHQLHICKTEQGYESLVIFDL